MTPAIDQTKMSVHNVAPTKPSRLSTDSLQRSLSDISLDKIKEPALDHVGKVVLPAIPEVEDAKCECCGLCEECTPEYISRVRDRFSGKLVCGLCGEAVKEEMEKNGGNREEALEEHMSECMRFNKVDRAYPVLYQAEAMREILRKCSGKGNKSVSPNNEGKSRIARSSSCIPAIARPAGDRTLVK